MSCLAGSVVVDLVAYLDLTVYQRHPIAGYSHSTRSLAVHLSALTD